MNLIELQPDDVLVLRCPHVLSREQQASLQGAMALVLGPEQRIVVLDSGLALDVIRVTLAGKVETNDIVREVQHVDTDEEPAGLPPHVWLYRNMLTDIQRLAPLGRDETNGQYAVAIDDLTDEQRAIPHVARQLGEVQS